MEIKTLSTIELCMIWALVSKLFQTQSITSKTLSKLFQTQKYYKKNIGSLNGQIRVLAFGKAQTSIGFYCCLFTNKLLYEFFVGNIVDL